MSQANFFQPSFDPLFTAALIVSPLSLRCRMLSQRLFRVKAQSAALAMRKAISGANTRRMPFASGNLCRFRAAVPVAANFEVSPNRPRAAARPVRRRAGALPLNTNSFADFGFLFFQFRLLSFQLFDDFYQIRR